MLKQIRYVYDFMNFGFRIAKMREDPETSNVGMKWTPEEELKLLKKTEIKMPIGDIATLHKRTISGIKARLCLMAYDFVKDGDLTFEEASDMVNIDQVTLKRSFKLRESSKNSKIVTKKHSIYDSETLQTNHFDDKYIEILKEIRDLLKLLTNKFLVYAWFFYCYFRK